MTIDDERALTGTFTVKVGQFGHPAHALHLALSFLTLGWWVLIYALHGIVWLMRRDTVTITVPEGGRVEWRDGHPIVLGPDEWLPPRGRRLLRPYLIPAAVAVVVILVMLIRS